MNFGTIIRQALQRAELPFDNEHLLLAKDYANDNISDLWSLVRADFREISGTIPVVAGTDEYVMPKYYDGMVLNSLRGPASNPRNIIYKDPIEFFRFTRNYATSTGVPNIFTYGKLVGYDLQLPAASAIKISSNLVNYVAGTVSVFNGSTRLIGAATTFTRAMIGLQFKKTGDTRTYTISDFVSTTELTLSEDYRGQTSSGSAYGIGDIDIRVAVAGTISGLSDLEEVLLNGTTVQTTSKSFDSIEGITKSSLTGGTVTATNAAVTTTIVTLAPGEYEVERKTIVLWRIPASVETLTFRYYRLHPLMNKDIDRLLFPTKYHQLVTKATEADLREWADKQIPSKLASDITEGKTKFRADAADVSQWVTIPQEEGLGFGLTDVNNRSIDADFVSL